MPDQPRRRRHGFREAAEEKADHLTKTMPRPKVTSNWSSCGLRVEVADDDALHHHADEHHEQRAGDNGDDERTRVGIGQPAGIAAEHEHRAVREVEDAERAVDDRQSG